MNSLVEEDVPNIEIADTAPPTAPDALQAGAAGSSADRYERKKVPLTLLTGYLGAGKSTLLEYVQRLPSARR